MAKKKNVESIDMKIIPVQEIEVEGVYKNWVNDLVKVLKIKQDTKQVVLYNITGSHKQWIDFKYLHLVKRIN